METFDLNISLEKSISAALHSKRFPHAAILEGGNVEDRMKLAQKIAAALFAHQAARCLAVPAPTAKKLMQVHTRIFFYTPLRINLKHLRLTMCATYAAKHTSCPMKPHERYSFSKMPTRWVLRDRMQF